MPRSVKLALRTYADGNRALLLMNSSGRPQLEAVELSELVGGDAVSVFEWRPGVDARPLGKIPTIVARLAPHEARLYYLSKNGNGPGGISIFTGRIS
jgi:hypothetical protein